MIMLILNPRDPLNDEYGGNFYYGKTLLGKTLENILPGKCEFEIQ